MKKSLVNSNKVYIFVSTIKIKDMTTTFENIGIRKGKGYGQYICYGEVNGTYLEVRTTDSEAYDYFDDEDYPEKQEDAINHVKAKLEIAFDNL